MQPKMRRVHAADLFMAHRWVDQIPYIQAPVVLSKEILCILTAMGRGCTLYDYFLKFAEEERWSYCLLGASWVTGAKRRAQEEFKNYACTESLLHHISSSLGAKTTGWAGDSYVVGVVKRSSLNRENTVHNLHQTVFISQCHRTGKVWRNHWRSPGPVSLLKHVRLIKLYLSYDLGSIILQNRASNLAGLEAEPHEDPEHSWFAPWTGAAVTYTSTHWQALHGSQSKLT